MPSPPAAQCRDDVLKIDAADWYHRRIKHVAVPVLVVYTVHALVTPGIRSKHLSISGDSGLTMDLKAALPPVMLHAHSIGALSMVCMILVQKELVRSRLYNTLRSPVQYASSMLVHRRLGYAILVACLVMDAAGYAMGHFSAFPSFEVFSAWFALPFAAWLVAIPLTARAGWLRSHRLASNMLLKGCIATPLSRLGGAGLQRLGWATASGYYVGIFGVACAIGLWQVADVVGFVREVRALRGRQDGQESRHASCQLAKRGSTSSEKSR